MKLKVMHIVEMLEYLHKEGVAEVEVTMRDLSSGYIFNFFDKAQRECSITIFQSSLNSAPELEKKMKLHTRLGRKRKDHIAEALAEKAAKEAKGR